MSGIQDIGQQIAKLMDEATASISYLHQLSGSLQKNAALVEHLLQSTGQKDYRLLLESLAAARQKVSDAASALLQASGGAQRWIGQHISGSGATHKDSSLSSEAEPSESQSNTEDAIAAGMAAIDMQMDMIRQDCRNRGITDPAQIEDIISRNRETAEIAFFNDLYGRVETKAIEAIQHNLQNISKMQWEKLDEDKRECVLNTLALEIGKAYRTVIKGVHFYDAPSIERGYYKNDGYLYLNSDCLSDPNNRLDALDTIVHEGRHAFQHAAILDPHRYGITIEQASIWEENFLHYLSPERFGYGPYHSQPVEEDAFGFAEYVMRSGGIL